MNYWKLLAILPGLFTLSAAAIDGGEPELLQPDQAFRFTASADDATSLRVTWDIADGYYLYRDRIRFSTATPGIELGTPQLPAGQVRNDEFFGKIAVYRDQAVITIPVTRAAGAPSSLELSALSQGCADIGVCFPPYTQVAQVDLSSAGIASGDAVPGGLEALEDRLGISSAEDDFLSPDEAFRVSVSTENPDQLLAHWTIADGYYLYRDKFRVELGEAAGVSLGTPSLPAGEEKHDEFFGNIQVFHHQAEMRIPLRRTSKEAMEITLQFGYQGCAEAGICYPPIKKEIPVALAALAGEAVAATPVSGAAQNAPVAPATTVSSRQDDIARVLQESGLAWVTLFFLGAGILLAFTACMYPMIPILSSIIAGQGNNMTTGRGFLLSLIYVEAMAVTYAVIGIVSAHFGAGVQAFFQNPWMLSLFALIFVVLALSMFGFFHLQLPASWQSRLSEASNRQKGGTLVGVGAMGVLSALIVGPCAGPVLIGALIYTSQSGDYLTGALAMFALGNGMGAPLLLIGLTEGKLLPRAGTWMHTVKAVFGVVLLGVAILMLERVLPGPVTLMLWALWLIIPAIYMGALEPLPRGDSGWRRLWKGLGIAMLVYGVILIFGATTGGRDPFNPLRQITAVVTATGEHQQAAGQLPFRRIKSIADFTAAAQESSRQGKPLMLDFYADWCTYCIKMEDNTFSDPRVQAALADVILLQADVTANDTTDMALLNHFGLYAPPAILFFGADARERHNHRLIGFLDADEFLQHLKGALAPVAYTGG